MICSGINVEGHLGQNDRYHLTQADLLTNLREGDNSLIQQGILQNRDVLGVR